MSALSTTVDKASTSLSTTLAKLAEEEERRGLQQLARTLERRPHA